MSQRKDESVLDWGDRVQVLNRKAHPTLPQDHLERSEATKFAHGLTDFEAGMFVANQNPKTLGEAITHFTTFQSNREAVLRSRHKFRQVSLCEDTSVKKATISSKPLEGLDDLKSILLKIQANQEEDKREIAWIKRQLPDSGSNSRASDYQRTRSRSPTPFRGRLPSAERNNSCYGCGEVGHFKNECPKNKEVTKIKTIYVENETNTNFLKVAQFRSNSALLLPLEINGTRVKAIVDTGAEKTIISDSLFERLKERPPILSTIQMYTAEKGSSFPGKKVGPVKINVGGMNICTNVFVGSIPDTMLFGLETLMTLGANICIPRKELDFAGIQVPMEMLDTSQDKDLAQNEVPVVAVNRVKIPSCSEVALPLHPKLPSTSTEWLFEPDPDLPLPVARAVFSRDQGMVVNFLNVQDQPIRLSRGTHLGTLMSVDACQIEGHRIRQCVPSTSPITEEDECLKHLWEDIHPGVSAESQQATKDLVLEFKDLFARSSVDLGSFSSIQHHIDTGDATPVRLGLRRTPVHFLEEEEKIIKELLDAGIIERSTSSWAAAPVIVKKKDGSFRFCLDYRRLNQCTKKDTFPIPLLSETLDALVGNSFFSKLDAVNAYYQVPLDPATKEKTAFRTRLGLFHFTRLPFGLCNAPSTFSRVMNLVLEGLHWHTVLAYLDDLCVLGKNETDHLQNLRKVLERLRDFGLKLKPSKCSLFQVETEFLGRWISAGGVTLTDHSLDTIRQWKVPSSVNEVQAFLGLANYHRAFIPHFSDLTAPLNALIGAGKDFHWKSKEQQAFEKLKTALLSPAVLAIPTRDGDFILDTDASDVAIGGSLYQLQDGVERVIAFGSFAL